MVILNFEEAGDWNRAFCHNNIKCVPLGTFGKVQHLCFKSIASLLAEIFLILCHTTVLCTIDDVISDQICIIESLNISGTKKGITKRKTPFYSTLKSLLNEHI